MLAKEEETRKKRKKTGSMTVIRIPTSAAHLSDEVLIYGFIFLHPERHGRNDIKLHEIESKPLNPGTRSLLNKTSDRIIRVIPGMKQAINT
jgi:hypothetical protein